MKFFFTVCCLLFYTYTYLSAQIDIGYDLLDSNLYDRSQRSQLIDFRNHLNLFPPRPRDGWEIGIRAGVVNIFGDTKSLFTPLGLSVSARKSLGYILSLRGEYTFGVARGRNNFPTFDFANDIAYSTYNGNVLTGVWRNYRTILHDIGIQALWSISNLFFHGERKKFHVYTLTGLEGIFYQSFVDALDATGNRYDFDNFSPNNAPFDGSFETPADRAARFALGLSIGVGMQYLLSRSFNIQLENKYTFTNQHDLDGNKYTGVNNPTFQSNNGVNYLSFGVNFILGNKRRTVEPLWQKNPLTYVYQELNSPRSMKVPPPKLQDTDGDGVADDLDREPNTLAGVPVDARGVTLDTDGDGVPDYNDAELITPSFCRPVDNRGIGICPKDKDTCCINIRKYLEQYPVTQNVSSSQPPLEKIIPTPQEVQQEIHQEIYPKTQKGIVDSTLKKDTTLKRIIDFSSLSNHTEMIINTRNTTEGDCHSAKALAHIGKKIIFTPNTADLLPISIVYLSDMSKILKSNPDYSVLIVPRVFPYETRKSSLADKRAEVIVDFLIASGISKDKIDLATKSGSPFTLFMKGKDMLATCPHKEVKTCSDSLTRQHIEADEHYLGFANRLSYLTQQIRYLKDSSDIEQGSGRIVRGLITLLTEFPEYPIIITAPYELGMETDEARKNLSYKRGKTLASFLQKGGIAVHRLTVLGINSYQPYNSVPLARAFFEGEDSDGDCVPDNIDECPTVSGTSEGKGCPVPIALQDTLNMIMRNVYFNFDKYVVQNNSLPYLDKLVGILKNHPLEIVVVGSTDTTGKEDYNLNLSFQRALWIKEYLKEKGVSENRIEAIGLGERRSVVGTEDELRRNRRVEFWIKE